MKALESPGKFHFLLFLIAQKDTRLPQVRTMMALFRSRSPLGFALLFSQRRRHLCEPVALLPWYLLGFDSRILERTCVHEGVRVESLRVMVFFLVSLADCLLAEIVHALSFSTNWCPPVKSNWFPAAPHLETHILNFFTIRTGQLTFSSTLLLLSSAVCLSPCERTSTSRHTYSLTSICNFATWEYATRHPERPDHFLWAACLSKKCSHRCSSAALEWETQNGHLLHVSFRGENCEHLTFVHCSFTSR